MRPLSPPTQTCMVAFCVALFGLLMPNHHAMAQSTSVPSHSSPKVDCISPAGIVTCSTCRARLGLNPIVAASNQSALTANLLQTNAPHLPTANRVTIRQVAFPMTMENLLSVAKNGDKDDDDDDEDCDDEEDEDEGKKANSRSAHHRRAPPRHQPRRARPAPHNDHHQGDHHQGDHRPMDHRPGDHANHPPMQHNHDPASHDRKLDEMTQLIRDIRQSLQSIESHVREEHKQRPNSGVPHNPPPPGHTPPPPPGPNPPQPQNHPQPNQGPAPQSNSYFKYEAPYGYFYVAPNSPIPVQPAQPNPWQGAMPAPHTPSANPGGYPNSDGYSNTPYGSGNFYNTPGYPTPQGSFQERLDNKPRFGPQPNLGAPQKQDKSAPRDQPQPPGQNRSSNDQPQPNGPESGPNQKNWAGTLAGNLWAKGSLAHPPQPQDSSNNANSPQPIPPSPPQSLNANRGVPMWTQLIPHANQQPMEAELQRRIQELERQIRDLKSSSSEPSRSPSDAKPRAE